MKTPTWHTEAVAKGIDYIVVVYGKAEGFVFCPTNLEKPFRVGGDYDGNMATDAKGARYYFDRWFNKHFLDQVTWFIPFVDKAVRGEDFSLKDLDIEERNLRIISGRWPW